MADEASGYRRKPRAAASELRIRPDAEFAADHLPNGGADAQLKQELAATVPRRRTGRATDFPAMGSSVNRMAGRAAFARGWPAPVPVPRSPGRGKDLQNLASCDASQTHDATAIVVSRRSPGMGRLL